MRRIYKMSVTIFLFVVFITGAVILRFYAVTDVNKRRVGAWFTAKMSRTALRFFGIQVSSSGHEYLEPSGKLIISNHMSYFDILVLASVKPTVFVSSVEIQKTPFLGFVASLGGTFFVERRSAKLVKLEIGKISDLIKNGFNVVLFPEGTSTDGSQILPFRSSLLAAATDSFVDVVPACIRYGEIDGKSFSPENCDYVCWYGDMSFLPHLWNFLKTSHVRAKVTLFEPIDTHLADRKFITAKARQLITDEYFKVA
ncbi:MAG: 1-acyl-sn-glycerol-3-phosphate acyltransferase [Denitrovibrio sp.]|nr:MAG: 1-acyl-sn-glycerol-3-phosphate acyltransferase [Denitrovibrio sp.]